MKLKINPNNVEFMISAMDVSQYPGENKNEIALSGRSNVGKSSFINAIVGRKNIARTSSKPGKTVNLNFYDVDDQFIMVDVPGYGYAKQSKKDREKWGELIESYLAEREELQVVVQLIDLRHKPTQDDILMYDFLKHLDLPVIVICTKSDKIAKSKVDKHLKIVRESLEVEPEDTVIDFSSVDRKNLPKVYAALSKYA